MGAFSNFIQLYGLYMVSFPFHSDNETSYFSWRAKFCLIVSKDRLHLQRSSLKSKITSFPISK